MDDFREGELDEIRQDEIERTMSPLPSMII